MENSFTFTAKLLHLLHHVGLFLALFLLHDCPRQKEYYLHFVVEESEAPRSQGCSLHSLEAEEQGYEQG